MSGGDEKSLREKTFAVTDSWESLLDAVLQARDDYRSMCLCVHILSCLSFKIPSAPQQITEARIRRVLGF